MANWKKVLVSGSNIEVNQISGSTLNLSGLGSSASDVLIIGEYGDVSSISQALLEGVTQTFSIGAMGLSPSVSINANQDLINFTTASNHGFSFTVGDSDTTSSVNLATPQDLRTTSSPNFAGMFLGPNEATGGSITAGVDGSTETSITLDKTNFDVKVAGNNVFVVDILNDATITEYIDTVINSSATPSTFRIDSNAGNLVGGLPQVGESYTHLIFTTGSQVLIGKSTPASSAKLHISGGDVFIEKGAISASLPSVSGVGGLVSYNTSSTGFETVSPSTLAENLGSFISGAFTAVSTSIAGDIVDNVTNIASNATLISTNTGDITTNTSNIASGIRFQQGTGDLAGSSILLTETASFVGTNNEVEVSHSIVSANESKFHIGLPDDVTIDNNLIISNNLTVSGGGITTTNITASGNISASGNLLVTGDVTLDGTLSFAGLSFINNQAQVLSGSTVFGSGSIPGNTTHQFTGSFLVTGSEINLDGGDLTLQDGSINVNLGGITVTEGDINITGGGLNALSITASSAISSSGHLFASLSLENHNQLVVYDTATGQFYHTASSAITGQNIIGPAEDLDYTDGLFSTWTNDTPTGTAIDLINEVLAGLAPSQAPDLSGLDATDNGADAYLSYGALSPIPGTSSVASTGLSSPDSALSSVDINGHYSDELEDGGQSSSEDIRLGVIDTEGGFTVINGRLNEHVAADEGTFVNYSADAFKDGEVGVLALLVNGTQLHSQSLSGSLYGGNAFQGGAAAGTSINANGSGFTGLSATSSAHFTGTGNTLDVFKHRSGSYTIVAADQREGWNYAHIEHQLLGSTKQTTYVEWVNESNSDALSDTTANLTIAKGTTIKTLSGVHYITGNGGYTGTYKSIITNAYRNVYTYGNAITATITTNPDAHNFTQLIKTGSHILHAVANTTAESNNSISKVLPSLNSTLTAPSSSTLQLTASYVVDGADMAVTANNSTPFIQIGGTVTHPTKATVTLDSKTLSGILFDNRTDNSTTSKETFVSESYRLPNTAYTTQTAVSDAVGTYPSSASLGNGSGGATSGLLIVPTGGGTSYDTSHSGNGSLIYPTLGLDDYNAITNIPAGITNPDYTSLTGDRIYMRSFRNDSGNTLGDTSIEIKGSGTIVKVATALSATEFHIALKYPPYTGFLDLALQKPDGSDLLTDGLGCMVGALTNTLTTAGVTNSFSFNNGVAGGAAIGLTNYIIVKITYGANFTGYISEIDIAGFA